MHQDYYVNSMSYFANENEAVLTFQWTTPKLEEFESSEVSVAGESKVVPLEVLSGVRITMTRSMLKNMVHELGGLVDRLEKTEQQSNDKD